MEIFCENTIGCKESKISRDLEIRIDFYAMTHSMATANLKKSEDFVTNTTAASKYIPRRPIISINCSVLYVL